VALTFDDGPHPTWTPRVLETLAEHGAKATFFLVGRKAARHPEIVKAIVDAGHAVGLHSWAHDRLFALRREKVVREDLRRGVAALERVTGTRPTLFRPPIGHTNPIIARVVDALDLTVVGWTIAGRDGLARARVDDVVARVRRDLRDGAIVMLHDSPETGDREPAAVKALPAILDAIAAERLEVVPLAPWLD
jgi:peptidoglycan/xylan/chitin deacetylase (PgdA/CDA1 family)